MEAGHAVGEGFVVEDAVPDEEEHQVLLEELGVAEVVFEFEFVLGQHELFEGFVEAGPPFLDEGVEVVVEAELVGRVRGDALETLPTGDAVACATLTVNA